jgi:hypothetical protein
VQVLAKIARHESDMDTSNQRLDAQRPRIVGIRGLGLERESVARTEATNLLLRRWPSVAQPVNEERRPVALPNCTKASAFT